MIPPAIATQTSEHESALNPAASKPQPDAQSYPRGVSIAVLLIAIAVADSIRFADPDLWGHLRFGELIIRGRHLINFDPFSYSAAGAPWSDHEWLSEVILAGAYQMLGVVGLKLLKLSCTALTIWAAARTVAWTRASQTVQSAMLLVLALTLSPMLQIRPQLFTFVLFAIELKILARHNYLGTARLWMLPLLFLLWVNLHGGFAIGIVTLLLFAGVAAMRTLLGEQTGDRLGAARLLIISAVSIIATFINPYGAQAWMTVFHSAHNPLIHIAIAEWQPLPASIVADWHSGSAGAMLSIGGLLVVIATVYRIIRRPEAESAALALVALMFTASAFFAARNLALALIACAPVLSRSWRDETCVSEPAVPRVNPIAGAILALTLVIGSGLVSQRLMAGRNYPAGAMDYIAAHHLSGNFLNDYDWGSYLIWHLDSASKVFIDGRCETVYPDRVIEEYLAFHFAKTGAQAVLNEYPHDYALFPPGSGAARMLQESAGWRLLYSDPEAELFARSNLRPELTTVIGAASSPALSFP